MSAHPLDVAPEGGAASRPAFVCPFCGTTYLLRKQACTHCGSNLVVPIDDPWAFEVLLPLCGDVEGV